MKWSVPFLGVVVMGLLAGEPARAAASLEIEEVNASPLTALTRSALLDLVQRYDLSAFLFTDHVRIESRVVPHSHPVLTLNTFYGDKPDELLGVFLHEQFHWFASSHYPAVKAAMTELRQKYPELPASERATPQSEESAYLHLIVCWLELRAVAYYLGEVRAKQIIAAQPYYQWIYQTVLRDDQVIGSIVRHHKLTPAPIF
jgi:hypothetical protein